MIDVWDDTLKKLGQWPIGRQYHFALIETLKQAGAKAVAFDMVFVEPHPADQDVADSAAFAGNVYFSLAFSEPTLRDRKLVSESFEAPLLEPYLRAAKRVCHVNMKTDQDGKRRRIAPVIHTPDGRPFFHLGFQLALDHLGINPSEVRVEKNRILIPGKGWAPLDEDGRLLISYAGKWQNTFQHYSYADILISYQQMRHGEKPNVDLRRLKDKVCIVGVTATASTDQNAIPLEPAYPMVGTHANVFNDVVLGDYVRRLGRLPNLFLCLLSAVLIFLVSRRKSPLQGLFFTVAVIGCYVFFTILLFFAWGLWADLFYPLFVFIITYASATFIRMIFEIQKREVIENELKIASQIQQSFLPSRLPEKRGLDLALLMKPAKAVGGDLYAFASTINKTGIFIGDVSGKGPPAALFMAKVVSEFKFVTQSSFDASEVLSALNNSLSSESTGGLFVTALYVIFDKESQFLQMSNGGHLPMLYVPAGEDPSQLILGKDGMPLGVMTDVLYSNDNRTLAAGDCIVLYTDGVTEARNSRKQEYGVEALQKALEKNRDLPAQKIIEAVTRDLSTFIGKAEPHDDITLIVLKPVKGHAN